MAEFLHLLPKPLLDDIYSGQCVPFIGAGFSKNATLPMGLKMPDFRELAREIGASLPDEVLKEEPLQIISYYEHEHRRPNLVREFTRALHIEASKPGRAHIAFARLPFDLVITTNFDFLLEAAYAAVGGRTCRVTIDETQLAVEVKKPAVNLIKMHGDLDHASQMIATEADYEAYLERHRLMATFIANVLVTKTPLFIGYSLDDYNFRQIFRIVKDRLGSLNRSAYALQFNAVASEGKRFERRGVTAISLPVKGKVDDALAQLFGELSEAWTTRVSSDNAAVQGPLEELRKPKTASTRLCLIIVPQERVAHYRSTIFPLMQSHHFDPILASDLYRDVGSETAVLGALFERADLIFADISTSQSTADFKFGLSQQLKDYVRIYCVADGQAEKSASDIPRFAAVFARDKDSFVLRQLPESAEVDSEDLGKWLERSYEALKTKYSFEPQRLYDAGEYTASLIASARHFEVVFREVLEGLQYDHHHGLQRKVNMVPNMRTLTEMALRENLISKDIYRELQELFSLRNRALHNGKEAKRADAQRALQLVDRFVQMLASGKDTGPQAT